MSSDLVGLIEKMVPILKENPQKIETEDDGTTVKKEFILINNIGMHLDGIINFFYNSSQEQIVIVVHGKGYWKWYVPLSEGPFILAELQKALNERKDFNFHFTRFNAANNKKTKWWW